MSATTTDQTKVAPKGSPTPIDLRHVRTQCERIRAEFRGLCDWIPIRPLSGAGLARWSGLRGPLCRRVLAAVQHRSDPAELARILPGVEGLTLFVNALERQGCPTDHIGSARQAIRAFAELLHRGGGSQRKLIAAIRDSLAAGDEITAGEQSLSSRRSQLFSAARGLVGANCEALVVVSILHRSPTRGDELNSVGALGRLGYRACPGAPPLIAKRYSSQEGEERTAIGVPGTNLQQQLGTSDLDLTQRRLDDGRVLMTCEDRAIGERPIDVWNGPVRDEGIVRFEPGEGSGYCSHTTIGTPSRTLVHDLWVEKPLAHASVLRAGVYRATPDVLLAMDYEQWYDRLPGDPQILLPGSNPRAGLEHASPRHDEVIEHCFEFAGHDRSRFVCYRNVVEYPIWMAVYRLTLEFAPSYQAS